MSLSPNFLNLKIGPSEGLNTAEQSSPANVALRESQLDQISGRVSLANELAGSGKIRTWPAVSDNKHPLISVSPANFTIFSELVAGEPRETLQMKHRVQDLARRVCSPKGQLLSTACADGSDDCRRRRRGKTTLLRCRYWFLVKADSKLP